MKLTIIILCVYSAIGLQLSAQNNMAWFKASSNTENDYIKRVSADCILKEGKSDSQIDEIEFIPREFFVYTNPLVKKYLKDTNLMECAAYVNKVGENIFLILEYKINSTTAKTNYGNLEKGGRIKMRLSNKDHVYLENIERSRGKVRRSDEYTIYTGTYAINKDNKNLLKKHNITQATVLWEEGVELYEIQNIDLVKNQLNYLEEL